MKRMLTLFMAVMMSLTLLTGSALAASKATPTPPPIDTVTTVMTPPAEIQAVLNLAYSEWETLAGQTLKKVNKYTEWRGKGVGFGWCGGFVTWCMMECGIPMDELENIEEAPVEGIHHVMEASVGKLLRGYMKMGRTTMVPQPGFLLVYGKSYNKTIHVGLVYDVEDLGGGKYRLTTIEGNMSNRVKMYVHDYDLYAEDIEENLSLVPEGERTQEETSWFNYRIQADGWYVNRFLMPWIPEDFVTPLPTEEPSPEPTLVPTEAVTETPAPTEVPTPAPTDEPMETPADAPTTAASTPIPLPTATPEADFSLFD